jgi:hypothetical protein
VTINRIIVWLAAVALTAPAQQVFFGNLHSHTSYSDGSGTPDEAYTHARDVAKLDFLAITEHNHKEAGKIATNPALYSGTDPASLISTAGRFNKDGRFVAIYGQEFSSISSGNHGNVFDVNTVISSTDVPNGDWGKLLTNWLLAHPDTTGSVPLLLLNHPAISTSPNAKEYGRDDFPTAAAWIAALDQRARLINIVNGPSHDEGTDILCREIPNPSSFDTSTSGCTSALRPTRIITRRTGAMRPAPEQG